MLSFVFGSFSPSPGSHGRSLGAAELELQAVGDEGDELGVRGLALYIRHGVAEKLLQHLDVAPVPCDLDRMADGSLDPRRRCVELKRNCRALKQTISLQIGWTKHDQSVDVI